MEQDIWQTRMTLLNKIKDRYDDQAWLEFVKYYERYIYNMLRRMRISDSVAEELCQKIIVKLWKTLPDFDFNQNMAKFRTWLCTVIVNTTRSHIKHEQVVLKHREREVDNSTEASGSNITQAEVEKIADEEWSIFIARLAWKNVQSKLPEIYTTIFDLYVAGKTSEEIASKFDMKYNTVNVYKKRAKDQILLEIKRLTNELF